MPGTARAYTFAAPKSAAVPGMPTTMKSPLTATAVPALSSLTRSDENTFSTTATLLPVQISGTTTAASALKTYAAPVLSAPPGVAAVFAPTMTSPARLLFTAIFSPNPSSKPAWNLDVRCQSDVTSPGNTRVYTKTDPSLSESSSRVETNTASPFVATEVPKPLASFSNIARCTHGASRWSSVRENTNALFKSYPPTTAVSPKIAT